MTISVTLHMSTSPIPAGLGQRNAADKWTVLLLRVTFGKIAAIESAGAIIHQAGSMML